MRRLLFWVPLLVLAGGTGAGAAATYWNQFSFNIQGITQDSTEAQLACWSMAGALGGYLFGAIVGYIMRGGGAVRPTSAKDKFAAKA